MSQYDDSSNSTLLGPQQYLRLSNLIKIGWHFDKQEATQFSKLEAEALIEVFGEKSSSDENVVVDTVEFETFVIMNGKTNLYLDCAVDSFKVSAVYWVESPSDCRCKFNSLDAAEKYMQALALTFGFPYIAVYAI